MRQKLLTAAALGLGLALTAGTAQAQNPALDIFDFSQPSSFFQQPGQGVERRDTARTPEADRESRPVVSIAAPQPTQVAVQTPAFFSPQPGGTDSFYDPIERRWITVDAERASGNFRNYTPIPRQEVEWSGGERPGTIVINTAERRLFLVLGNGRALRYGIGVGRDGFAWRGEQTVTRMAEWPDWRPPVQMLQRRPDLPRFMPGGPSNPLGARAMYLGSTLYRIHGSNEPHTIGHAVSSGCFRMTNDDVTDLYNRVRVGARVVVR